MVLLTVFLFSCSDGADGKDGVDGTNGVDGIDGKDGADGKDGTDGQDGADGKDGTPSSDFWTPQATGTGDTFGTVHYANNNKGVTKTMPTEQEIEIYNDKSVRIFSAIFWEGNEKPPDDAEHTLLFTWLEWRDKLKIVMPFPKEVIKAFEKLDGFKNINEAKEKMGIKISEQVDAHGGLQRIELIKANPHQAGNAYGIKTDNWDKGNFVYIPMNSVHHMAYNENGVYITTTANEYFAVLKENNLQGYDKLVEYLDKT